MNDVVKKMLEEIEGNNPKAVHEVFQQIALAGLYRGGFFDIATFYGGTCLRIFHGLDRFSEDLDFSLNEKMKDFNFEVFFDVIVREFNALDIEVSISKKTKKRFSAVESAFLKTETSVYDLKTKKERNVKIKIEVDTNPPLGFDVTQELSVRPFSFYAPCFSLPDLFAGKMHAVIHRKWKRRVKGRDFYDFEWFVRNAVPLNLKHFAMRSAQTEGRGASMSSSDFKKLLLHRIKEVDFNSARDDVARFVKDPDALDIWSEKYFLALAKKIRFA